MDEDTRNALAGILAAAAPTAAPSSALGLARALANIPAPSAPPTTALQVFRSLAPAPPSGFAMGLPTLGNLLAGNPFWPGNQQSLPPTLPTRPPITRPRLGATYVIFDGDKDQWAYLYMRGWEANDSVDFDFRDAHDLTAMTSRAQDEAYVKSQLRQRMKAARQVIVLVGESTRFLRKYVGWEIDLAIEFDLPIIVVNLQGKRVRDDDRCPVALRDHCAVHIDFKLNMIRHVLKSWPSQFAGLSFEEKAKGWRKYESDVYVAFGL